VTEEEEEEEEEKKEEELSDDTFFATSAPVPERRWSLCGGLLTEFLESAGSF
jgi:hypothetical protein